MPYHKGSEFDPSLEKKNEMSTLEIAPTEEEILCGACGAYVDPINCDKAGFHFPYLCSAFELRSLFIEAREWFDKVNGNSYFSARIQVNGEVIATLPFQYGYERQFESEAQKTLLEMGYLPQKDKHFQSLSTLAEKLSFDYYAVKYSAKHREMFKAVK